MSEFWSILSLLRSSCEDNADLQQTCQVIASNYIVSQKKEICVQFIYEQNIILKLEVGNLECINDTITKNNEIQIKLDSLLSQYYDQHLKCVFNVDECEFDKLSNFDVLKLELENRPSVNLFQQLYDCKMETAKKMEDRNIVKKYRQEEQEFSKTKDKRLALEERVKSLKIKYDEMKAREKEEIELIVELVAGSKELENLSTNFDLRNSPSQLEIFQSLRLSEDTPKEITPQKAQKVGLSSKLMLNFKQFEMPPIPRIQQHLNNQNKGLRHLLQQSEVIRKSIQTKPIVLSNEIPPTPHFSGILKTHKNIPINADEIPPKTVSFDIDLQKKNLAPTMEFDIQEETDEPLKNSDSEILEIVDESEMEESVIVVNDLKPQKIEIIENIVIKPAEKLIEKQAEVQPKSIRIQSPVKISPSCSSKDTSSSKMPSKSFMDMLYGLATGNNEDIPSPAFEPVRKSSNSKTKQTFKEKDDKPKTKGSMKQFDEFEKMFSNLASNEIEGLANNDQSFDFFLDNNDGEEKGDDDAESDTFSFNF